MDNVLCIPKYGWSHLFDNEELRISYRGVREFPNYSLPTPIF